MKTFKSLKTAVVSTLAVLNISMTLAPMALADGFSLPGSLPSKGKLPSLPTQPVKPVPVKPGKRALLVMLENGGFKAGFPAEIGGTQVSIPTGKFKCGNHVLNVGDPVNMVAGIAQYIATRGINFNDPCLDATKILERWRAETVTKSVVDHIKSTTDFFIEHATRSSIQLAAQNRYDRVVFLEDNNFNADLATSMLISLSREYVVDVHTLAHGSTDAIVGGNSSEGQFKRITRDNFFKPMQDRIARGTKLWIRAVYQQNCYGSSFNADWISIGAKVVSGAKLLNYMPLAYAGFLREWLDGADFRQAVMDGYNQQIPMYTLAMTLLGRPQLLQTMISESLPLIRGNGSIDLND